MKESPISYKLDMLHNTAADLCMLTEFVQTLKAEQRERERSLFRDRHIIAYLLAEQSHHLSSLTRKVSKDTGKAPSSLVNY